MDRTSARTMARLMAAVGLFAGFQVGAGAAIKALGAVPMERELAGALLWVWAAVQIGAALAIVAWTVRSVGGAHGSGRAIAPSGVGVRRDVSPAPRPRHVRETKAGCQAGIGASRDYLSPRSGRGGAADGWLPPGAPARRAMPASRIP